MAYVDGFVMPVPKNLNYDMWLGSTPEVPYTEKRVHPQTGYDRPGWLRCEQFGAGMITGWGAHHVDSAHWGMNTEFTGPIDPKSIGDGTVQIWHWGALPERVSDARISLSADGKKLTIDPPRTGWLDHDCGLLG